MSWDNRLILEPKTLGDGKVYHCLQIPELYITKGIPVLKVVRAFSERKRRSVFGLYDWDKPWIAVDFYLDSQPLPTAVRTSETGGHAEHSHPLSSREAAILRSPHRAIQELFRVAIERPGAPLPEMPTLLLSQRVDARLIAKTNRLLRSIQPLLALPALWSASTLGHIGALRHTWFHEVIIKSLESILAKLTSDRNA